MSEDKVGYGYVRPLPVVRDEHGEVKGQTVRELVAKIDEELNELKGAGLLTLYAHRGCMTAEEAGKVMGIPEDVLPDANMLLLVAEEAADTITAITTLEEALGIDAEARDEAQRRVNEKNRSRNRL